MNFWFTYENQAKNKKKTNAIYRSVKFSFNLKGTLWCLNTFVFGIEEKISARLFKSVLLSRQSS